jgi:hypothetical protein
MSDVTLNQEEDLMTNLENPLNIESPRIAGISVDQLVDRREQLDKFTDVLDQIGRQGTVVSNIFEWYGSPGIGKTMLVALLARRVGEKQAISTVINFKQSEEKIESYLQNPVVLISQMISDFKRQAVLDTREFDLALQEYQNVNLPDAGVVSAYLAMNSETRLYSQPDWLKKIKNVIIAFVKLVVALPSQEKNNGIRPVVIFFDETEHADVELVDWLEEWVISPLVQIKHCVVVWTARRPWRWKRPEIKRRLTSELLKVFGPDMVKEQIKIQSESVKPDLVSGLFKNVYTLTGGHPFANYIVINELDNLTGRGEKITPETFPDFESKLLEEIFDRFVNKYALSELASNDLKIACKFIALVRSFDSTMLRRILQACAGDLFAPWKQEDFGDLMVRMKKTQLLVWEKGNAIDPSLRHIIQKYFMVLDRKTFINANRAALQVYQDWLARPVDNRCLFVLEELYHNAALLQVGEPSDLNEILTKRLEEYPGWIKDEHALDIALERLEGEISNDKELEQFLPPDVELVKQIKEFRDVRLSRKS